MNIEENVHITGEYHCFSLAEWVKDGEIIDRLRKYVRTREAGLLVSLHRAGVIQRMHFAKNLLPTVGLNVVTRRWSGDTTYTGEIDYGALGSAAGSFTIASTQLGTELFRKQAASQAHDNNIAYIDWFIASGDVANQTFQEFGAFIDGTGVVNTGRAHSLLKTGGWVKSGSMYISGKYTITNA